MSKLYDETSLGQFLDSQGLVIANVEFLTDEDIESLCGGDIKIKIALKTVRKQLLNGEQVSAFDGSNNNDVPYEEDLPSQTTSGTQNWEKEEPVYSNNPYENADISANRNNNGSSFGYDLPPEELGLQPRIEPIKDNINKRKSTPDEINSSDISTRRKSASDIEFSRIKMPEYTTYNSDSTAKVVSSVSSGRKKKHVVKHKPHKPLTKAYGKYYGKKSKEGKFRDRYKCWIYLQISISIFLLIMILLQIINLVIGIIPYAFYPIEIINWILILVPFIIVSAGSFVWGGMKHNPDCRPIEDIPFLINCLNFSQMGCIGLIWFGIFFNVIFLGWIPWCFYFLEIVVLLLLSSTTLIASILTYKLYSQMNME